MQYDINELITRITSHPTFLKLKDVVEINSYHDHEDVYSHSIKTKDTALDVIQGDFITDPEAKKAFLAYVGEEIAGMKRGDVMILTALVHDIGKALSVEENGQIRSILETRSAGNTACPGHEFHGSLIIGDILRPLDIPNEVITGISHVIAQHDAFNEGYLNAKQSWPIDQIVSDVKSRAEGHYLEAMFNIYCDNYTAAVFDEPRKLLVKLFNSPTLYTQRKYVLP